MPTPTYQMATGWVKRFNADSDRGEGIIIASEN